MSTHVLGRHSLPSILWLVLLFPFFFLLFLFLFLLFLLFLLFFLPAAFWPFFLFLFLLLLFFPLQDFLSVFLHFSAAGSAPLTARRFKLSARLLSPLSFSAPAEKTCWICFWVRSLWCEYEKRDCLCFKRQLPCTNQQMQEEWLQLGIGGWSWSFWDAGGCCCSLWDPFEIWLPFPLCRPYMGMDKCAEGRWPNIPKLWEAINWEKKIFHLRHSLRPVVFPWDLSEYRNKRTYFGYEFHY